jgi:hypothetical protein
LFLASLFEIDRGWVIADVDIIGIFEVGEIGDLVNLSFLKFKFLEQVVSREQMVLLDAPSFLRQ